MKRLLIVAESSLVGTGYGTLAQAFISRLHQNPNLQVCEFSTYSSPEDDPRRPWPVIHNRPRRDDPDYANYTANLANEMGGYGFERALLTFKPDAVWTYRDAWYDSFVEDSPLRGHFRHLAQPAIDAERQHPDWLSQMARADAVLTYTEWAAGLLAKEGGGLIPVRGWAPPGADYQTFHRRADRDQVRASLGLGPESRVIGYVCRNQSRKLFPDLFEAFGRILKDGPAEVRHTCHLYVHAGYPDEAWHLPELASEFGVGHRLLVTYRCPGCKRASVGRFQDATAPCECGGQARLCGPGNGITREELCLVYNVMDVYSQVSTNEGLGMPSVEAAACEVPVLAVDYSAMGDVARKLGGQLVKVARTYTEPGLTMGRRLALPCLDDLTAKLTAALLQPEPLRRRAGLTARVNAMRHFDYDASAAKLAETVLSLPPALPWDGPARPFGPEPAPPDLPDGPFVRWCIEHLGGRPDLTNSATAARMDRQLFWGQTTQGVPFGRQQILDECKSLRQHASAWDYQRTVSCGLV